MLLPYISFVSVQGFQFIATIESQTPMIDLSSIFAELLLEQTLPKAGGLLRAYREYLDSVRLLLSQIVRRAQQSPVESHYAGTKRRAHTYFRFIREYRAYLGLFLPHDERDRYQKHAVSSEYHQSWGLYFYWLGHDRQNAQDFAEATDAFKKVSNPKSTLQKTHPLYWHLASCDVHKAVLLGRPEMEHAKEALVKLERQARYEKNDETRQKMWGAIGHLWIKLIGHADNAYNKAKHAYEEADKNLERGNDIGPRYSGRVDQLMHDYEGGRVKYRRPLLLTLHSRLPGLTYISGLLWVVTCVALCVLQPWRSSAALPQAFRQAGLSVPPIVFVIFFISVGWIFFYMGFQGIRFIRSGLFTTGEPDPRDRSVFPPVAEPETKLEEMTPTPRPCLAIKCHGDALETPQKIVQDLCITNDGRILQCSELSTPDLVAGRFEANTGEFCFKPKQGIPWYLTRGQSVQKPISTEGIIIREGDRIEAKSVSEGVNGKVYNILGLEINER